MNRKLERGFALACAVLFALAGRAVADPPGGPMIPIPGSPPASSIPQGAVRVLVTDCIDGDTITVRWNGHHQKVRFKGVDTPETVAPHTPVQPWGPEASHYTRNKLDGEYIWLEFAGTKFDMFGRMLAYVWLADGTCHNETLITKGLARVQRHYHFDRLPKYDALEKAAKLAKVGIWS